jgi:hypothetical protein
MNDSHVRTNTSPSVTFDPIRKVCLVETITAMPQRGCGQSLEAQEALWQLRVAVYRY